MGTINKNIFKQHSEVRTQLQTRHEQMVNDINQESVDIANELGDYIEQVADMIFSHHTTILEALGATVTISESSTATSGSGGRRLQERMLPTELDVTWPEGLSSFWHKLQVLDINTEDIINWAKTLKAGVVSIQHALDIEVPGEEPEEPREKRGKKHRPKHEKRRLAMNAEEKASLSEAFQANMIDKVEELKSDMEDVTSKIETIETKVEELKSGVESKVSAIENKMETMMGMLAQLIEQQSMEGESGNVQTLAE